MAAGWELVATFGIVLVSGLIVGLAGFGFALFAVPPLLLFHEPATVVVLVNMLGFVSCVVIVWGEWHAVERTLLRSLLPWACLGLAPGTLVLRFVDETAVKLLASAVVAAFAVFMALGARLPGAGTPAATAIAGVSSGALGTSVGLPGPPIALLFTARDLPATTFRVTLTGYFAIVDLAAIVALLVAGQIAGDDLWLALLLAPASLLGRWGGRRAANFISQAQFRRMVIGLLVLTGAVGVASALAELI